MPLDGATPARQAASDSTADWSRSRRTSRDPVCSPVIATLREDPPPATINRPATAVEPRPDQLAQLAGRHAPLSVTSRLVLTGLGMNADGRLHGLEARHTHTEKGTQQ